MEEVVKYIVENWDNIPEDFKQDIRPSKYDYTKREYTTSGVAFVPGIPEEDHTVVMLLDRQKPSVPQDYDFDEERIGVAKSGAIIWGFDSGCSCPSPFDDSYPDCYNLDKTYKEFILTPKDFDPDWEEQCVSKLEEIKRHHIIK